MRTQLIRCNKQPSRPKFAFYVIKIPAKDIDPDDMDSVEASFRRKAHCNFTDLDQTHGHVNSGNFVFRRKSSKSLLQVNQNKIDY